MAASTTSLSLFLLLCGLCFSPSVQQQDGSSFYFKQEVFLKPSTTDLEYDISFIYGLGGALAMDRGHHFGRRGTRRSKRQYRRLARSRLSSCLLANLSASRCCLHLPKELLGQMAANGVPKASLLPPYLHPSVWGGLEGSIQQLSFPSDSWNTTLRDATGAVYVFLRERNYEEGGEDERWRQEAFIGPPIGSTETGFGSSLAITKENIMVGGMQLDDSSMVGCFNNPQRYSDSYNSNLMDSGAAVIYKAEENEERGMNKHRWSVEAVLKAAWTDSSDHFGSVVAADGKTILISATGEDSSPFAQPLHGVPVGFTPDNSFESCGAVYVFVREMEEGNWTQQAFLKPPICDGIGYAFGRTVSLLGDVAVIGTAKDDQYVFVRNQTSQEWSRQGLQVLPSTYNWSLLQAYGISSAMTSDELLFVGAPFETSLRAGVNFGDNLSTMNDTWAVWEDSNIPGITYDLPTEVGELAQKIGAVYVFASQLHPCDVGRWNSFSAVTVRIEDEVIRVESKEVVTVDGFLRVDATLRMKVGGTESRTRKNPVMYLGGCADIIGSLELELDSSITEPTEFVLLRQEPSCSPLEPINVTTSYDFAFAGCSSSFLSTFNNSTGHLGVLVHPDLIPPSSSSCVLSENSDSSSSSSSSSTTDGISNRTEGEPELVAIVVPSVIGGLLLLLAIAAIVVAAVFIRRRNLNRRNEMIDMMDLTEKGDTIYGNISADSQEFGLEYLDLEFGDKIGHGSFGEVYQGKWRLTLVAIKPVKQFREDQLDDFKKEAEIMQAYAWIHSTPSASSPLMPGGSLDSFLRSSKGKQLTHPEMIRIAMGIHGWHAAPPLGERHSLNVLLSKSLDAKVSDFGMARVLNAEDEEHKTMAEVGPIRWMAPESMKDQVYSAKSDVWSFGVVLFEIASFGEAPYKELANLQVSLAVISGSTRLKPPEDAPQVFEELMSMCFATQPEDQPSFTSMHAMLSDALEEM
ncbi:Ephrin type-A receptor 1 [Balamuthia mandrillaris]